MDKIVVKKRLIKIGKSHYIGLPIEWLQQMKFNPRDNVILVFKDNAIVIRRMNDDITVDKLTEGIIWK